MRRQILKSLLVDAAVLLEEVAAGIKTKGGEALALPADLTREDEIVELFATVQKTFGRLDVLVNNAGIATHRETEDISLDYWRAALDINITAPFLCSRVMAAEEVAKVARLMATLPGE